MEPLVPMANLLQRSLCWQRAPPAFRPRGGLEAGSTALSINHPDLRGSLSWSSLGEECRKGGGHAVFSRGNFRCIVTPAPGHPMSRSCLSWEEPLVSRPSKNVGFGRRPSQQDGRPGPGRALPPRGQDTGRELGTSGLALCKR